MNDLGHPTGHCFNGANQDVNVHGTRLMTAFRDDPPPPNQGNSLSPSSSPHSNIPLSTAILEPRYQRIMQEIPPGNEDYSKEMMQLCWHFQRQGEVPVRPSSDEVKDLFRSIPYPKTSTGKGSKGGMRHHECLWPQCTFKDTLQKCMDHLFSQHMKVKFYRCGVDNCTMLFARKFDCDKHKNRTHNVPRPRAAGRTTPAPARPTRASTRRVGS